MKYIGYAVTALAVMTLLSSALCPDADARRRSKKKAEQEMTDSVPAESVYDKLFKDKKYKTADGLFKIHLLEDETLVFELPKSLLGKDMLLGSSVLSTSDGGDGFAGFLSPTQMHVRFQATDSLVLLTKVSPKRFITDSDNVRKAVDDNNIGAVIAVFPIETLSPDSTALVFKPTDFFKSQHKELDPVDKYSANSFGGMLSKDLTYDSQTSALTDVSAYPTSVAVTSRSTYTGSVSFLGSPTTEETRLTACVRMLLMLLPEEKMAPRYADPRIGVMNASFTRFSGREQGSEEIDYAVRWNMDRPELVFYVDTLFPEEISDAIVRGVEKWNDAFSAIGRDGFVRAVPYPGKDFDSDDPRNICIKYEVTSNSTVRSNIWADPRTGELIGAGMYVPYDVLAALHSSLVSEIGAADRSVLTVGHGIPAVYSRLQAEITHETGRCLGLDENLAASTAVPVDSLRSPSFTSRYGLSGSVMDNVPANYIATADDLARGVRLINTELGRYDYYVVRWLYGTVDGASSPDEERPFLDSLVSAAAKDPLCLYVRTQPYFKLDPRTVSGDLGDDPVYASKLQTENLKKVTEELDSWIYADRDYTFRPYVNASIVLSVIYGYMNAGRYIGGILINETAEGDGIPAYQTVPRSKQKEVLEYLAESFDDLSWLDNTDAYRDIFFIKSPAAYVSMMVLPVLDNALSTMDVAASFAGDEAYTSVDAYKDLQDIVLKYARSGRKPTDNNITMQYQLLGFTMAKSDVSVDHSKGAVAIAAAGHEEGLRELLRLSIMSGRTDEAVMMSFDPVISVPFYVDKVESPQMYQALLEARKVYQRAASIASDETARNHYRYFVMAIDRALKID